MKKDYSQPSIAMEQANLEMIICGSQSITSDNGITYGGVDEEGTKDPSSRKRWSEWDDEDE